MTEHFTLQELTYSYRAQQLNINNQPSKEHLKNLLQLARKLEEVRAIIGKPIVISSAYRCPALNKAVGGVSNSSHCQGLAADFTVSQYGTPEQICRAIEQSSIEFDQLIFEQGNTDWVHLGIGNKMRKQVLSWKRGVGYVNGVYRL